jgi:hypothetical protein
MTFLVVKNEFLVRQKDRAAENNVFNEKRNKIAHWFQMYVFRTISTALGQKKIKIKEIFDFFSLNELYRLKLMDIQTYKTPLTLSPEDCNLKDVNIFCSRKKDPILIEFCPDTGGSW